MTLNPPTPYTAATGNFLTAGLWNAQVRDGVGYLMSPPVFRAHQEVAQSLGDNLWVTLNLETEEIDNYGGHSTTTNTSRYTCQVAGTYMVSGIAAFVASATGPRGARLLKNNVAYNGTFVKMNGFGTGSNALSTTALIPLAVGDYVELQGFQNSGGALNSSATSGDVASSLSCLWVSQ
jgi:hypothetical protein